MENKTFKVNVVNLTPALVVLLLVTMVVLSIWGPAIAKNLGAHFREGYSPAPETFLHQTSHGPITCKWVDRGMMMYSRTGILCDEPATFYGFKTGDQWQARQNELDQKRSGPVAQSIASAIFDKVSGVNTLEFGRRNSGGGSWVVDRYMIYVGISPGYEDRQEEVLATVAEIVTATLAVAK
jgi:hypothetical protein